METTPGTYENVIDSITKLASTNTDATSSLVGEVFKHEVEVQLSTLQSDQQSPLYSVSTFEELGLPEALLKGVYAMGFNKPSKIQEKALPLLLSNPPRNLVAQSQSGTGKTAAFVLTMLSRVDTSFDIPQAVCLSPTRELARQIGEVVTKMGQFTNTKVFYALKDTDVNVSISAHIVIGTPGTLLEMCKRRTLRVDKISVLVYDEADAMLDKQGMGDQSIRLKKLLPRNCQIILFSATYSPIVRNFAMRVVPDPNTIVLKKEELNVERIKQFYLNCNNYEQKYKIISDIYGLLTVGQSIIFCERRTTADELYRRMTEDRHTVSLLHAGLESSARDKILDEFRNGTTKVLIATNVLARGIDILQVSLVVNFDLPVTGNREPDYETYLHRIGRTGRFGRNGVSINLVQDEISRIMNKKFEEFFQREIVEIPADRDGIELIEKKLHETDKSPIANE